MSIRIKGSGQIEGLGAGVTEPGGMSWNTDESTMDLRLNQDVTLQVGEETLYRARNNSGVAITNGTVVMANGTNGNSGRLLVTKAIASVVFDPHRVMGIATEDMANNGDGFVTSFGKVRGIQTNGANFGETWVEGDVLYASQTVAGALTKVRPGIATGGIISIAIVVSPHASNGTLFVRPLIEGHGSDIVRFTPSGTGAVATDAQRKLREFPSVVDYGADPTGVADSTAAFTAAILAENVLMLPAGTYSLSGLFFPRSGQKFIALGKVTLKKKDADANAHTIFYMADKSNIVFDGQIVFDGNGANQTASGSSGKALIEIWNNSNDISLNNIEVINAYKWGIYLKGGSGIIPKDIKLNGVVTSGSLGYVGGVAGADGTTGFVIIAGAAEISNSTFYDRVDLEANVAGQTIEANFSTCKFYDQLDSGVNGTAGSLTVTGCTFFAKTTEACARIYGGVFAGNTFTDKAAGTVTGTNWDGIHVLGNNNYGVNITGNTMLGPRIGVGLVGASRAKVSGNNIFCAATSIGSITLDGQTIPFGGISGGTAGAVRLLDISNNTVQVTAAFNTAGGYGIDFQSSDCRSVSCVSNTVSTDAFATGKIYFAYSRSYAATLANNAATVTTNLTSTLAVVSVTNGYTIVRASAAPSVGTWVLGDQAFAGNPPNTGFIGWVCTVGGTPGTWKTFGAVTP